MAYPIAFRLGLKNAGRFSNFLSLAPKVCILHAVFADHNFFNVLWGVFTVISWNDYTTLLFYSQGKAGILACKRYGTTALSYEQVS